MDSVSKIRQSPPAASANTNAEKFRALAEIAVRGLVRTYSGGKLPHTMRCRGTVPVAEGENHRYALIALLGLARAKSIVSIPTALSDELWSRVSAVPMRRFSPGDLGLALWASVLHGKSGGLFTPKRAMDAFELRHAWCDSVELAWLLIGADHAVNANSTDRTSLQLSDRGYDALHHLYNSRLSLFYRHRREGVLRSVARRVPCFAHQIYPLMALAFHAKVRSHQAVLNLAGALADNLCRMQGTFGQWWWLYDADEGGVVDGYPVFSVHQDGMAPMALAQLMDAGGRDHSFHIARSLRWIEGENELDQSMILPQHGLILRDIHRRKVGRVGRAVAAALLTAGRKGARRGNPQTGDLTINRECRPYHLGWVLYAAGLLANLQNS